MKKFSAVMIGLLGLLVLGAMLPAPASAGLIDIRARLSMYSPSEGGGPALMYGLGADVNFDEHLTLAAAAEYAAYSANGHNYTLMPITLDLIYRLLPGFPIDPFLGAGLGIYNKGTDGVSKSSLGGQLRAGVQANLGLFGASADVRYVVPDFSDTSRSGVSYGLQVGGALSMIF
jgi:hypothetical protein